MRFLLSTVIGLFFCQSSFAQITITAADMPASGDTLRYSNASPVGVIISPKDSGLSMIWNYSLKFMSQGVDTYRSALAVNPLYALTIGPAAYGYKVADTFPGPLPIEQLYTFFEKQTAPSRYVARAFGAKVAGIPTPANYSPEDVWYTFPLTYLDADSNDYELNISIPGVGGIQQKGYRKTRVDGWGIISTPGIPAAKQCLRVRSEIHEMDSITVGTAGFPPVPRNTVEYKWLAVGEPYPLLWVTSNVIAGVETITSIKYKDRYRDTTTVAPIDTTVAVNNIAKTGAEIAAWPNPAINGIVTLSLPASWKTFFVEVFDMYAKQVATFSDNARLDITTLPAGKYLARVSSGTNTAYVVFMR